MIDPARRIAALAALIVAMAQAATAEWLSISNASFEDISGQSTFNEFTLATPNAWQPYNPSNLVTGSGLYLGTLAIDGTFFDATNAPHGHRVAILYNQTQKGAGEYGIEQTLGHTLTPRTRYALHVEVGNIGSGTADNGAVFDLDDFPGYRIELLAGDLFVATGPDSAELIPERSFRTDLVSVSILNGHPGLNQPLRIRLISLNQPAEPDDGTAPFDAHEVDFDHVRIEAIPITHPIGWTLDVR